MSGQIEINEVEDMVLRVYKERKALANGLKDSAKYVNNNYKIINIIYFIHYLINNHSTNNTTVSETC